MDTDDAGEGAPPSVPAPAIAPDRPVVACLLAGGTGSRLYPASRSDRPKQFLPLAGDDSLLARTAARAGFADGVAVVTREAFADRAREHAARGAGRPVDVVVEPEGKDTGPALAYATHELAARYDDPVVLALPSDHLVADDDAFAATMSRAARVAAGTGRLVTVGVEPTRPDTGYGYVEPGAERTVGGGGADAVAYRDLVAFHEKPDRETAREYVAAGHLWNAGTFAWTPEALFEAARDSPLAPLLDALEASDPEGGFAAVDPVSVDYAVMERLGPDDAAVVPAGYGWDDLGSWDALARVLDPESGGEAAGNVVAGDADALAVDAADNLVAGDKHVSLVGVEGLTVVAVDDRVLVVPTEAAQRVREVADRLKERGGF